MGSLTTHQLVYRDQFRSLFKDAFQEWCGRLLRHLYPIGKGQGVRISNGDAGIDYFVIDQQHIYQIYAPSRMDEQKDSETAEKIRADFAKVHAFLGASLKAWTFLHNHPEGLLGKLSAHAVLDLQSAHPGVDIRVLNIDTFWNVLETLDHGVRDALFHLKQDTQPDRAALPPIEQIALARFKPELPAHHVPRPKLLEALARIVAGQRHSAISQPVGASGDGGLGKTMLSVAYASQALKGALGPDHLYPGGVYFISVGEQSPAEAFAQLVHPSSINGYQLEVDDIARLASQALARLDTSLLIIDNVIDEQQWGDPAFTALIPAGNCRVLATTRAESLGKLQMLPVTRLEFTEAVGILSKFRPSAAIPDNEQHIRKIYDHLEGMALAVAAAGALMHITEDDNWSLLAQFIALADPVQLPDQLPAVREKTQDITKSVVAVLDALRARLPEPQRVAIDLAALLPQDAVPTGWLEDLVQSYFQLHAPDQHAPDPAAVVDRLISLGILTARTSELENQQSPDITPALLRRAAPRALHRLHVRRSKTFTSNNPARQAAFDSLLAAYVQQRLDAVIGPKPLFPTARSRRHLRWELSPLAAYCHECWSRRRHDQAARIASRMGFAAVEIWRPVDVERCLPLEHLSDAALRGDVNSTDLPRALAWRAVWASRNRRAGEASRFTTHALDHHRARSRENTADYAVDLGISAMCIFDKSSARLDQAEDMARQAINIHRAAVKDDILTPVYALDILAGKQRDNGKYHLALQTINEALPIVAAEEPAHWVLRAKLTYRLGTILTAIPGREAEARDALNRAEALYLRMYPEDHKDIQNTREALAALDRTLLDRSQSSPTP